MQVLLPGADHNRAGPAYASERDVLAWNHVTQGLLLATFGKYYMMKNDMLTLGTIASPAPEQQSCDSVAIFTTAVDAEAQRSATAM